MARAAIVGATVFASIASSTVVVGLDTADFTSPVVAVTTNPIAPNGVAPDAVAGPASARVAVAVPTAATDPDDPCEAFARDYCDGVPAPRTTPKDVVGSCADGETRTPTGTTDTIPADGPVPEGAYRIRIEVERGLSIDGECFAGEVLEILNDARSWGAAFAAVADESYDLRLVLASPATTDRLCSPADTAGIYSCRRGNRVVINLMRWETGTDDYRGNLTTYRQYLINHEVGHFLGRGHAACPGAGQPAPVMMQQTKGLGQCLANGWPTESEHETRN
jgi:hypothetical protein